METSALLIFYFLIHLFFIQRTHTTDDIQAQTSCKKIAKLALGLLRSSCTNNSKYQGRINTHELEAKREQNNAHTDFTKITRKEARKEGGEEKGLHMDAQIDRDTFTTYGKILRQTSLESKPTHSVLLCAKVIKSYKRP